MRISAGRLVVAAVAPFIAAGMVAVVLMLLAIVATEVATTIDIPYLVTYTGTKDPGGGGRTLYIDGSWTVAVAIAGILACPMMALALFLPD
ncbi:hypothetical protein [Microbacterium trichothecenolyticum]|uniref:Uncharacterized protein n=1 Tax=Microbacterium trichothecenolyticum TaxID=69370 RepID=A0ABU0TWC6_MICTR|nr:hypothetical protein [Microbacterium trichothecenolyticum]MDQ1123967.1 hypothetical protein [Microbacterium trichothecenolyticum]